MILIENLEAVGEDVPTLALKIRAHNSTFKYRKFCLNQDKSVQRL